MTCVVSLDPHYKIVRCALSWFVQIPSEGSLQVTQTGSFRTQIYIRMISHQWAKSHKNMRVWIKCICAEKLQVIWINCNKLYSSFIIHKMILFYFLLWCSCIRKKDHKRFFQINFHLFVSKNKTSGLDRWCVIYIGFGFLYWHKWCLLTNSKRSLWMSCAFQRLQKSLEKMRQKPLSLLSLKK